MKDRKYLTTLDVALRHDGTVRHREPPPHEFIRDCAQSWRPRICVCVMMNHPFPKNIPLIRRLYRGRFSKIVFVMPFERSDDPDVFTVYRGGYSHAAFITDIRDKLAQIECDYFLIVHDDVLINPQLSEETFLTHFPLAPDDAFIPLIEAPGEHIAHHSWYTGVIAKLLFPKSPLFGSGMDAAGIIKYMPPIETVRAKLDAAGVDYRERVRLDHDDFHMLIVEGSRALLHGHATDLGLSANAAGNNAACTQIMRQFIDAMVVGLEAETEGGRLRRGMTDAGRDVVLPFPIAYSSFYTDFYILPRSKLNLYAHYMGVWSATGALIEFAVATILHICCDKVWTADQLGLKFAFFEHKHSIGYFQDPAFMAIHPFKFSAFGDRASQDRFFHAMDDVVSGDAWPQVAEAGQIYRLDDMIGDMYAQGWHASEVWGRWQAAPIATVPFRAKPEQPLGGIALILISPTGQPFAGSVAIRGRGTAQRVVSGVAGRGIELTIPAEDIDPDGINEIEVIADQVVRPCDLTGAPGDERTLGFGLCRVTFL